jgi:hypothetical protein
MALTAHQRTLSPPPPSLVYGWKNPTALFLFRLPLIRRRDNFKIKAERAVIRAQIRNAIAKKLNAILELEKGGKLC